MPLFLEKKLFFIHIPKTGGTSVEKFLTDNNNQISFFTSTGSVFINGHTPQHITFREIQNLGIDKDEFLFFTIIRNPVERVISEYKWLCDTNWHTRNKTKIGEDWNFDIFLEHFLNYDNSSIFDNHNLSNFDYIVNLKGEIDNRIQLVNFFDIEKIEKIVGYSGLKNYREYKGNSHPIELNSNHIDKIKRFYSDDYKIKI